MKKVSLYFSLYIITFISLSMNAQQYELIWEDNFEINGKPNPDKWSYETGFVRNLEKQIYTKRLKNARIRNGKLELKAIKENFRNKQYDPKGTNYRINTPLAKYTSASIHTAKKFEFQYGRVDVRAKLPKGKGVWAAIWMLGANFDEVVYPNAGEIDIMEHVGKEPDEIHSTVHYPWPGKIGYRSRGKKFQISDPSEDYHIYSVDWDQDQIEFFVDGKSFYTFQIKDTDPENNPFHQPFYIILNLAIGGNWPGAIDNSIFPQKFLIDYVKVYKKIEEKKQACKPDSVTR